MTPRTPRRATAVLVCAALAAAGVAGCVAEDGEGRASGEKRGSGSADGITAIARGERSAAPALSAESVTGQRIRMRDFRGEVVVLNVWGSACAPCRAEAPALRATARDTRGDGVRFVGINRDRDAGNARGFERKHKVPYPSWYDPDGQLVRQFPRDMLMPQAIPNTLVIDRDGKIAVRILAKVTAGDLRRALKPVLAERPSQRAR
ncbi:TlpA family protein disulfide reductase [Streptomyces sp. NPDC048172]|uniref:TlpA family protein disulfide reductase n=1 Tax=Streptomyces sp. NPDC048172 TaxID=3365505 RepID=UPI0037194ADB